MTNNPSHFAEYRFVFAFENTLTELDYVTEKVFLALLGNTVPVYLGTKTVSILTPDRSVIWAVHPLNAEDVPVKARHLADTLKRIGDSYEKWASFFDYRSRPMPAHFPALERLSVSSPEHLCRVCDCICSEECTAAGYNPGEGLLIQAARAVAEQT